ncbi:MAG: methylmalonyl-CoA mutase family protein [Geminicoccaceae bacterium]
MDDRPTPLASGFDPADEGQWLSLVEKVLKGKDFEAALVSRTADGIPVRPLYGDADRPSNLAVSAGVWPYTRGSAGPDEAAGWDIRQICAAPLPADAGTAMAEDLAGGCTSIELRIDRERRISGDLPDGIVLASASDLAAVLGGDRRVETRIAFDAGPFFAETARMAGELGLADVDLGADPLTAVALGDMAVDGAAASAVELARTAPEGWRVMRAGGVAWHAAGASDGEELAAVIATGIAYMRALVESGMTAERAARQIGLRLAVDTDIFSCIAKLRAARRLWAQVLRSCGVGNAPVEVEAITASRMLTRRDAWTNLLRTTVATFAAICGGARVIGVLPHDWSLGYSSAKARRLARNIQIILMEESQLHRVVDPAGGAFAIESLTDALAEKAWEGVQRIEASGGMEKAIVEGSVQERIASTFAARLARIATNREPVIGVSRFPLLDEIAPETRPLDESALPRPEPITEFEPIATPLSPRCLADGFERLRDLGDRCLERNGMRPRVFLACIGSLAEHGTRASFARNAFEAGGIEAITSAPITDGEAAGRMFAESGCRIACICGTDERYAGEAGTMAASLRDAGAEAVYLAGRKTAEVENAGVDTFLHASSDLLGLLEDAQSLLIGERP